MPAVGLSDREKSLLEELQEASPDCTGTLTAFQAALTAAHSGLLAP